MKKIISVLLCIAMLISMAIVPASAETFAKEWEFEGSVLGFGANNSTLTSVGGNLVQTITTAKNNTWLLSPSGLNVDASVYKYLKVRVKNSTTTAGLFRFQATGTNKADFTSGWVAIEDNVTPNDGKWHEYVVDLSQYGTEWSGTISRFRLCMSAWNCEGTVEYDYIRLSDTGDTTEDEGEEVEDLGWEFDGSILGFGANNSTATSVGGCLVQTITTEKNNTWLLSPNNLGIDASVYKYLKVRVKNSTSMAGLFRFEATGTNKSAFANAWVPLADNKTPNDGKWHEYVVDLSQYGTEWSGTISRFRLCMSAWNCEGTVEYDYIILSATSEAVGDEGETPVPDESTFSVSTMFGSGCVIQRDIPYEVWGRAEVGERVTVTIGDSSADAVTDDNGKWTAQLPALSLSDVPYTMTVSTESGETISYEDILAGDVWLCSGQSNMQWSVQQVDGAAENIANAGNYKNIRIFKQTKNFAAEPLENAVDAQWYICNSESVKTCSAIGYNFAKEINESENVPIGILNASYGGQMIERFIENSAIANGKYPSRATSIDYPSGIYNSMIAPLTRYRIKGVLWYQGESDSTSEGNRERYPYFQQLLLDTWESAWGFEKGTMPFLFAQLTSYGELDYKEIREIQHQFALDNPNTAMAVLMDCGDESNLHPKDKVTPAHRLALAALNKVYGHEDVEYKYPYAVDFELNENAVTVTFTDVYDGLKCNGEVAGFKLCGADGEFYDAEAVITSENTIKVVCDEVSRPTEIRYGYEAFPNPTLNLYNSADIPACPFAASLISNDSGLSWVNPCEFPSNKSLGEEILLEVATDNGEVESVEYFANGVSIGIATASPYAISWKPQQAGGYYITAVASIDGTTVTSEEIYVNVYDRATTEDDTYYWQFDETVQGFAGNSSTVASENGCLVQTLTTAKSNTFLVSPNNLGADASMYKYLKLRVKNSTSAPGLFRFEATGTNKSDFAGAWVPIADNVTPNDGEWHEYVIDLSQYGTEWSGTISRFRLCMSAWNCEGTVEFDYIKLSVNGEAEGGTPAKYEIEEPKYRDGYIYTSTLLNDDGDGVSETEDIVYVAAKYDNNGRFVAVKLAPLTLTEGEEDTTPIDVSDLLITDSERVDVMVMSSVDKLEPIADKATVYDKGVSAD